MERAGKGLSAEGYWVAAEHNPDHVRIRPAAEALGISTAAIRDWRIRGLVQPVRGRGIFSLQQLRALRDSMGMSHRPTEASGGSDAVASMAAREARGQRLSSVEGHAGIIDGLALRRAQARYSVDAMAALRAAGKLVSAPHAATIYRSFIKEVKGRIQAMPTHYTSRLTELGVDPKDAHQFLQETAASVLEEVASADLLAKFQEMLEGEDG